MDGTLRGAWQRDGVNFRPHGNSAIFQVYLAEGKSGLLHQRTAVFLSRQWKKRRHGGRAFNVGDMGRSQCSRAFKCLFKRKNSRPLHRIMTTTMEISRTEDGWKLSCPVVNRYFHLRFKSHYWILDEFDSEKETDKSHIKSSNHFGFTVALKEAFDRCEDILNVK